MDADYAKLCQWSKYRQLNFESGQSALIFDIMSFLKTLFPDKKDFVHSIRYFSKCLLMNADVIEASIVAKEKRAAKKKIKKPIKKAKRIL